MFDQQKMAQTVLNLAQDYTTTTMQVMRTSMEMYEKTLDTMMKQGAVAQEEGQKLLADWTSKAKQGQKNYWDMMDDNIKKMSAFCCPNKCNTERKRTPAG
jgi:polyhydroxyalkanoate synthesis regulator phasin